jgi:integrase/recombinase XerD
MVRLRLSASARSSQLDRGRRQLTVRGKSNKIRVIDLEPFDAWRLLADLPVYLGKAPLFWHGNGEPYRNVSSRFSLLVT